VSGKFRLPRDKTSHTADLLGAAPPPRAAPVGVGYAKLVYHTHPTVAARMAAGELARLGSPDAPTLIQCAEQLEDPVGYMTEFRDDVERVLTVLPRQSNLLS
jgi:hypothetical protein